MTSQTYAFGFDLFEVDNCRSKGDHNDSDWLTISITSNNTAFPAQKVLIGNNVHTGDTFEMCSGSPWRSTRQHT